MSWRGQDGEPLPPIYQTRKRREPAWLFLAKWVPVCAVGGIAFALWLWLIMGAGKPS